MRRNVKKWIELFVLAAAVAAGAAVGVVLALALGGLLGDPKWKP